MDGLDALLAEATSAREEQRQSTERKVAERVEAEKRSQQRSTRLQHVAKLAPSPTLSVSASVKHTLDRLKCYLTMLLDPSVLDIIAHELSQRSYADLKHYCDANPKLVDYTMTQELNRMTYLVTTRDGRTLSEPADIRAMHTREALDVEAQFLWAASNQSLLADFIAAVQPHWMEAELSISVRASRCVFELDLRQDHWNLCARCGLSICTLGVGDTPLEIATAEAVIEVDVKRGVLCQRLEKARLCECVIFEEQLFGVATALSATGAASDAVTTAATPQRSVPRDAASGGASIDDVAQQLEAFMTADTAEAAAAHDESGAGASGGGLLSSLWAWGSTPTQPQLYRRDDDP